MSKRVLSIGATVAMVTSGLIAIAPTASATGTTVTTHSTSLGLILANAHGRTLYLFTRDTTNRSLCNSTCAKTWPRLMTSGTPHAGTGVTQSKLGQTSAHQVTYYGHPLYYFNGDTAAGQTKGQGRSAFSGRWWVVSPRGAAGTGTTISLRSTRLGSIIVGPNGHTLYLLDADSSNHSTCYSACATNWPPVITTGRPHVGSGLSSTLLGNTLRTNGTRQVTYHGHPLYYFSGDTAAGQTNGEGQFAFNGYWYAENAGGSAVTGPPSSPY